PGPPGRGAVAEPGPGGGVAALERAVLHPAAAHPARPGCWPGLVAARRSAVPARRFHCLGTLVRQPGQDTTGELAAAEDPQLLVRQFAVPVVLRRIHQHLLRPGTVLPERTGVFTAAGGPVAHPVRRGISGVFGTE